MYYGPDPKYYPEVAAKAEEVGFESVWLPEHLILPTAFPDTHRPIAPETPFLDPFVAHGVAAGRTKKVLLGTGVYILPLRNPFVTARAVATLDYLSNGRAVLGCGIGWLEKEFEVVGETWTNRAGRTREIVEILKRLWTEDVIEHHGKYYDFGPVKFEPKPVRKPRPPILMGGNAPAALRRAAEIGDGWYPSNTSIDQFDRYMSEAIPQIKGYLREFGREKDPFEINYHCTDRPTLDLVRRAEEAGATRFIVSRTLLKDEGARTLDRARADLEDFSNTVLVKLR